MDIHPNARLRSHYINRKSVRVRVRPGTSLNFPFHFQLTYLIIILFRFYPAFYQKIHNFAMLVIIFIYSYLFIMAHSTIQYIKTSSLSGQQGWHFCRKKCFLPLASFNRQKVAENGKK